MCKYKCYSFGTQSRINKQRVKMLSQSVFGILIVITCFMCYYNSINCGFVFDDISAIKENKDLRPHTPLRNIFSNDFWGTPMQKEQSHKSYRPLCVLTFRWNYAVHGLDPGGYHLVNMVLHCIVSLMYFKMCTMFLSELMSFVAAILFAVHPIHTEAVTGVVGRAETLSSVFFLAAFLSYAHATKQGTATGWKQLLLSSIFVTTAMLCKEQGITVTGICAIYEIFVAQKVRLRDFQQIGRAILGGKSVSITLWPAEATKRMLVLCLSTIGLLFVRLQIMGSQLPVFTRFDNPASVAPTPHRQLTYNYLASMNLWLLLFPCNLCCDWTMGTVPIIESLTDSRNLATILTYLLIAVLVWIAFISENVQQTTVVIMGLSFMILPFLPASNLFFPVGFVIAERVLYMPSMGFCLLIAYGFHSLLEKLRDSNSGKKLAWAGFVALILIHSIKTYNRNADWESEYSIFMSGLRVNRRNAKLFNNVGHALEGDERYGEALNFFHTAVSVQADDVGAHINVGRTYNHLKMFKEAEEAYLKAKSLLPKAKPGESYQARIAPNHLNVFLNLANLISKNQTRLEEADMLYRQAISMRADYTQAYINRGDILIKLNRTKEAQEVYERALLYDSNNPDIYYNLGVVFLEQGKASQALAYLDKALEFNPEHEQALLNSAILLQELGRADLRKIARERLLKLLTIDDKNERVYFNLGMLAMDDKNIEEAENWFKRAVHLKQDFRSALFNLALLLADDQRPLEAAPFLNQLVKYHPDHIKGLILLGDIYINNIKDLDAAENCYKRILQLDPVNIQGLHNLCVVYVERGRLIQAQACLKHAHQLAPTEDYILRHLQIIQNRIAKIRQQQQQQQQHQFNQHQPASDYQDRKQEQLYKSGEGNDNAKYQAQANNIKPEEERKVKSNQGEASISEPTMNNKKILNGNENTVDQGQKPAKQKNTRAMTEQPASTGSTMTGAHSATNSHAALNKSGGTATTHPSIISPSAHISRANDELSQSLESANGMGSHKAHNANEFTFAGFDPRDFGGDRLYLADDDHYSHEIKKNNALNHNFNNHNYYGQQQQQQPPSPHQQQHAQQLPYQRYNPTSEDLMIMDGDDVELMAGDGASVRGTSRSVLIDKDLINDLKKPKPVAIGDTKYSPVNSKG